MKFSDEQLRLWAEDNGLAIHEGLQLFDFPTTGRGFIAKKLNRFLKTADFKLYLGKLSNISIGIERMTLIHKNVP